MLRLLQITSAAEPPAHLQLNFSLQPDPAADAPQLLQWLQQFVPLSRFQAELSMDLLLIRFSFRDQPFYLHAEHYTGSCWIDTDSAPADMLMSELHALLAQDLS